MLGALGMLAACSDSGPLEVATGYATTSEDIPVQIDVHDDITASDGGVTILRASAAGHRVEVLDSTTLLLTPKLDFNGVIDVSYDVSNHHDPAVTGHVLVTVSPVNDPPIATGGSQQIKGAHAFVLGASDVDSDVLTLTYRIVTPPAHGVVTGTPPALQYAPNVGFVGDDQLSYTVSDGAAMSKPGVFLFHVTSGSAPSAFADFFFLDRDQSALVALHASDPDQDVLTYTIVTPPAHGALTGTSPNLTYTPTTGFAGSDAFSFSVSDGVNVSNTAQISLLVQGANRPPVAVPQTVTTAEDTALPITLVASDPDGNPLQYSVTAFPAHGTLSPVDGANVVYSPASNFAGQDSFAFRASDLGSSSASVTVTINVTPVNDPPFAQALNRTVQEDIATPIGLMGGDVDGDPITYAIASLPAHGTLTGVAPAMIYTPAQDYNGPDAFTYTVSSNGETAGPATVTITVAAVNDPPIAAGSVVTTAEDTPVAIALQASDVDSSSLSYTIDAPPADGVLSGAGATRTYTPAKDATGMRSFVFRVSDGALSTTATVTIMITPVNDPPVVNDDYVVTDPGTPLTFDPLANDTDVEGDALALDSVAAPGHGAIEIAGGKLVYTPDAGFTGVEVIAYTVVDASGAAATGHAHIGVGTFPPGAPIETLASVGGAVSSSEGVPPAISGDGRYIAFSTTLALVAEDTNGKSDVYVYDRGARTVSRVSVGPGGIQSDGSSLSVALSADGRYVAYVSDATNLIAGDTNAQADIFRFDRATGQTLRVSVATGGGQASSFSVLPAISDDGNLVAFRSDAFDLVANDANGVSDVFVHDVAAGTTERVSVTASGGEADLTAIELAISGDGRYVAFSSSATNLVPGDTNNTTDIFVRDRVAGTTTRVSVSSTGGEANAASSAPAISRDGRFVSFLSTATNLATTASSLKQAYVRDVTGLTTTRPVSGPSAIRARLSGDGRYLAIYSSAGTIIRDRFAAVTYTPPSSTHWFWPALSGDGRYLVVLDNTTSVVGVTVAPNPL